MNGNTAALKPEDNFVAALTKLLRHTGSGDYNVGELNVSLPLNI